MLKSGLHEVAQRGFSGGRMGLAGWGQGMAGGGRMGAH